MPIKAGATVRVVNIDPVVQKAELCDLLGNRKLSPASPVSLFPSASAPNATQIATVTFKSPSEAKNALSSNGAVLRDSSIAIDRDFMGLTVLAAPKQSQLE